MIISENSECYRLISQNDHDDLAGQFAAHWGNDRFTKLEPYQSMVLAVEAHDNGWCDWDIYPSIDEHGAPIPYDAIFLDYSNPMTGGRTFPTLSYCVQMLRAGEKTQVHGHTNGTVYHVVRGQGTSFAGAEELHWEMVDCFVLPLWHSHRHLNHSSKFDAILFSITDSPILESLGLLRTEPT